MKVNKAHPIRYSEYQHFEKIPKSNTKSDPSTENIWAISRVKNKKNYLIDEIVLIKVIDEWKILKITDRTDSLHILAS